MKTIIAGSRIGATYDDLIEAVLKCPWKITSIISGGALGVDSLAEEYAYNSGIPIKVIKADWTEYGKAAGPIMLEEAQAVLAIWDGESKGTKHMIDITKKAKKPLYILHLKKENTLDAFFIDNS
jgi:hypothetical protein